ncbi:MAG: class I SAM-dependent methyltransferase [Planctomycetota bacterium]
MDRFECYELCVQSPRHVAAFLRGVHGNEPVVLREDFCGTAAVSRRWCEEAIRRGDDGRAVAVDFDAETVAKARELVKSDALEGRLRLVCGDALPKPALAAVADPADVVFVGNFSIGYIKERETLVAYLKLCHRRLAAGMGGFGGGVFVCDLYGGASAYKLGGLERRHPSRGREVVRYSWQHEAADQVSGMVTNSISFRVEVDGEVVQEWPRAFVYEWRLWSLPELREAMREAGFASVEVYKDVNVAPGERPAPILNAAEIGEDWIVLVVARLGNSE